MGEVVSFNPNPGVDYHLRALGIRNRADWEFITRDDRNYQNEFVVGRPDIVLRHVPSDQYVVVEYKSRALEDGKARDEEIWQAVINAVLVGSEIYRKERRSVFPEVAAVIMYGDGKMQEVTFDDDDRQLIYEAMVEMSLTWFYADGSRYLLPASELAQLLAGKHPASITVEAPSGSNFFGERCLTVPADQSRLTRRREGTKAHEALRNLGPEIKPNRRKE